MHGVPHAGGEAIERVDVGRHSMKLGIRCEEWPDATPIRISREVTTSARVVVVELEDGERRGRGECCPYPYFGESVDAVVEALEKVRATVAAGLDREGLQELLPAGAARNALDCAMWDLEAKRSGTPVWRIAGAPAPRPLTTTYTLGLDTPEAMAEAARRADGFEMLKLKLGADGDLERVAAIHEAAPGAELVVDVNEAWTAAQLEEYLPELAAHGVRMLEQPLPAGDDAALRDVKRIIPICADESCWTRESLPELVDLYDMINIKLDKAGGLTEALALAREAHAAGLEIMVGCMPGTSLAMAPATVVGAYAPWVDLDTPLFRVSDREHGLRYENGRVCPPSPDLWG
jgi:L-alanine-DL-glutamate epimerase-like enolase superfamily enzyme